MRRRTVLPLILAALAPCLYPQQPGRYYPPPGRWDRKAPAELGFDADKLRQAVEYAQTNGSTWDFDKDQVRTFGIALGPLPKQRAATNGIILRHGYIVAEFGDTKANDPVYSVAKSFLSVVASLAVERGLIKDIDDPVAKYIHDGGYDSPHNARITWKNHLQQTSEWEGRYARPGPRSGVVGRSSLRPCVPEYARLVTQRSPHPVSTVRAKW